MSTASTTGAHDDRAPTTGESAQFMTISEQ
jgi:hypothetical protein